MQAVETVGSAVLDMVAPGVGRLALTAYSVAKQSYMGSLHGGTLGATAGGVSALVSAPLTAATGVNASASYSFDGGWGLSLGVGAPMPGSGGFTAGGNVNFQEGEGFTGGGMNLGYQIGYKDGPGGTNGTFGPNIGTQFDRYGNYTGASIAVETDSNFMRESAHRSSSLQSRFGINLDAEGHYSGLDASVAYTRQSDGNAGDGTGTLHDLLRRSSSYTIGGGLSYNRDGSFSVNTRAGATYNFNLDGAGYTGTNGELTGSFNFDENGGYSGVSQNARFGLTYQTQAQAEQIRRERLRSLRAAFTEVEGSLSDAERAEYETEINRLENLLNPQRAAQTWGRESIAELLNRDDLNPEEEALLLAMAEEAELTPEMLKAIGQIQRRFNPDADNLTGSRDEEPGFFASIANGAEDLFREYVLGQVAEDGGFVDPETGEWRQRTCFVAGTLVRVHPETAHAFSEDGQHYKRIEEIKTGDVVLAWDEESGQLSYRRVVNTFVRQTDQIYRLSFERDEEIQTTHSHPFYVIRNSGYGGSRTSHGEWVEAKHLRVGDRVQTAAGQTVSITAIGIEARSATVYNFEVIDEHNYFVGRAGVLVHNEGGYAELAADARSSVNALLRDRAFAAEMVDAWVEDCVNGCNLEQIVAALQESDELRHLDRQTIYALSVYLAYSDPRLEGGDPAAISRNFIERNGYRDPELPPEERLSYYLGQYDDSTFASVLTKAVDWSGTALKFLGNLTGREVLGMVGRTIGNAATITQAPAMLENLLRAYEMGKFRNEIAASHRIVATYESLSPHDRLVFERALHEEFGIPAAFSRVVEVRLTSGETIRAVANLNAQHVRVLMGHDNWRRFEERLTSQYGLRRDSVQLAVANANRILEEYRTIHTIQPGQGVEAAALVDYHEGI